MRPGEEFKLNDISGVACACDARGQGTPYLVILDQRVGECADHGNILERRLSLYKPSMRKYSVFDELEDGARDVALRRILARRVFLEMGGENGTVVPDDVVPGHQVEGVEIDEVDWNLVGGKFGESIGPDFRQRYGTLTVGRR